MSHNPRRSNRSNNALGDGGLIWLTAFKHSLVIALAVVLVSACEQTAQPLPEPKDSWYRPVDNPAHEFTQLPPFLYSPVKLEHVDEAVQEMGDGPLLQLSTSEAIRYADDRLRTVRELRPFLIHGLYRTVRTFNVSIADRALWVDSLDDPDDTNPVKRQPLVLYMDEVPPDVYVTVSVLESEARRQASLNERNKD